MYIHILSLIIYMYMLYGCMYTSCGPFFLPWPARYIDEALPLSSPGQNKSPGNRREGQP